MAGERWPREVWLDGVYASDLPAPARHVAMVLAHHARDSDRTFMGYAKLRDFTGLSRSTVVRAVAVLLEAGLLQVIEAGTPKRAARYRITTPGVVTVTTGVLSEGLQGVVTVTTPVVTQTTGCGQPDHTGVVTESTDLTNSDKSPSSQAGEVIEMRQHDPSPLTEALAVWSETHPGREAEALNAALGLETKRGVTVSHPARYFATWTRDRRAAIRLAMPQRPPCRECHAGGFLLDPNSRQPIAPCPSCKPRKATG